ncbi:alpha-L-rhamnosidase C-terminal domain-containing protein [Paenibacillus sp.]|uniref:alpha-L-rhamnosidase-related protein n=1 Tax=Paenibacillus sp. TaxID=58172 RepID=UPI002811224F|nr:alpha-L-rhamnosidase C-terminal domain-containing protein [Paenibacillus sp.]
MENNRKWRASWIWADGPGEDVDVVRFRRAFHLPEDGTYRLNVRVSADSRYRLYVNGALVSFGPAKGDPYTHYYDTVEASSYLRPGRNVIAAIAVHYGTGRGPLSVWRSPRGAFLLEGDILDGEGTVGTIDTDAAWTAYRAPRGAFALQRETFTLFVGGGETVDGRLLPHGWERPEFDGADWPAASIVSATHDRMYGQLTPWQLTERTIPPMRDDEAPFREIVQGRNGAGALAKTAIGGPLEASTVAAGDVARFELDAGEFMSGHVRLELTGGAGATVRMLYSECYEYPPGPHGERRKAVRDDPEGKALYGFEDVYVALGLGTERRPETYEPLHRRAFRFIALTVEAGEEAVCVRRFSIRRTGYPLDVSASFSSSDASLRPLWDISLNTLRNCMHETYEDTPYYEQMQYELDTRLQALFTYYVSADDRLARKAMYDFHSSLLPSGMLQSRYPSVSPQVIPGFALFWIMMVHDHYRFFADESLVRMYRPTMDAVLGWFEGRRGPDGLVGAMPEAYWSFVDWTFDWRDTAGAPPAGKGGPLTVYNLMYAASLDMAAELNERTGRRDTAAEYRERAASVRDAVRLRCRSAERGLFRDGPEAEQYSQHAQIWAVLSGTVAGEEAARLLRTTFADASLAKASYANTYYAFRALASAGLYADSFSMWDAWREQVELHLTAWVEDPVSVRSDCHAWGAMPLHEFPAELLGVKPREPGFAAIELSPTPGPLTSAEGVVATPRGRVAVAWSIAGGEFALRASGPADTPVVVVLPNGETRAFDRMDGAGIEVSCAIARTEEEAAG